jgi:threonine/homoserine/homoserine lactone efflux protein
MGVYAITPYATDADGSRALWAVAVVALSFGAVSMPCIASWTALGQQMRRFLTSPRRLHTFNIIMALVLVLTLVPVVFPNLFTGAT